MQLTESLPGLDFSMYQCFVSNPKDITVAQKRVGGTDRAANEMNVEKNVNLFRNYRGNKSLSTVLFL